MLSHIWIGYLGKHVTGHMHGTYVNGLWAPHFPFQSQVDSTLELNPDAIDGELLRVDISCPGYSGCLPFKMGGGSYQDRGMHE